MNNYYDLEWEISDLSTSVNFMDLTISIVGDRLETTIYEKPMALYLYIPPHSAHPPGVRTGHVFGEVLRIHRLCTHENDVVGRIRVFFRRLMQRGHKPTTLLPLFEKALANAHKFMATSEGERLATRELRLDEARRRVYFHVIHHPQGPKARDIQQLLDLIVLNPPGKKLFTKIGNSLEDVPLEKMIIANHRALNLEHLLSYRKLSDTKYGSPISAFLED